MCVDEDDNIMCGCGRFMWETQSVALQSDSPVGMTNHGFDERLRPTVALAGLHVDVCDESLVIQRAIFRAFHPIDHCGCQDTYNF